MAAIVYQKDNRSGITYAYESVSTVNHGASAPLARRFSATVTAN